VGLCALLKAKRQKRETSSSTASQKTMFNLKPF